MYNQTLKEIIGALAIMAGTCVLIGIGAFGVLLLTAQSSKEIGKEVSTPYFDDYTEIIKSKTIEPVTELTTKEPLVDPLQKGIASWYDYDLPDYPAYSKDHDTCASRDYPKGTLLLVSNTEIEVVCRVNDYVENPKVIIDLSSHAFSQLAPLSKGLIVVVVQEKL